jgi:propanediol utilization protein
MFKIIYERSNKHLHGTEAAAKHLHVNTEVLKPLSVLGEAVASTVIHIPDLGNVKFMVPYRDYCQLELTMTEHHKIFGEYTKRRASGDLEGTRIVEIHGFPFHAVVRKAHAHVPWELYHMTQKDLGLPDIPMDLSYNDTKDGNVYVHLDNDQYNAFKGVWF